MFVMNHIKRVANNSSKTLPSVYASSSCSCTNKLQQTTTRSTTTTRTTTTVTPAAANPIAGLAQNFVEKVVSICANDEDWKCYRMPEIDPNTTIYETFYGQSCMLAPVSYDILHAKQDSYHPENSQVTSKYTECVTSIITQRLDDAINNPSNNLGYGLKRIIIGGVNKATRDNIMDDARYANADHTVTSTVRSALYKEHLDDFARSIDLERLEKDVIAFNFDFEASDSSLTSKGRSGLDEELMIEQIKESGFKYVMKRLDRNDAGSVVSLNNYGNYGLLYSNEFDFYVENCLNYKKLPHYGVYTVLPPTSLFGPRLKLIGCSLVHMANLSIGGVAVDNKYRRHGIASALLYQCAKDMFEINGFDMVYAHYREGNEDAMKWFESMQGWKQLDRKHFWITLGYDANPTID